jgi:hypothetical protein
VIWLTGVGYIGKSRLAGVAYSGESRLPGVGYTGEPRLAGIAYTGEVPLCSKNTLRKLGKILNPHRVPLVRPELYG